MTDVYSLFSIIKMITCEKSSTARGAEVAVDFSEEFIPTAGGESFSQGVALAGPVLAGDVVVPA